MAAGQHCENTGNTALMETVTDASALKLQMCSTRTMFILWLFFESFCVITMKAGTPKRKHSSFSLEETKIKCYYLFTSVQFNVWSEGNNSFRRCILLHTKLDHTYYQMILPPWLWESALKLYIKEIVLLKSFLMGAALARVAVRVIA